jgi:hypothetical protein
MASMTASVGERRGAQGSNTALKDNLQVHRATLSLAGSE